MSEILKNVRTVSIINYAFANDYRKDKTGGLEARE